MMNQQQYDMGAVLKTLLAFSKEKQDDISDAMVLGATLAYMGEHDVSELDPRLVEVLSSTYHLTNAVIAPKYDTDSMLDLIFKSK